MEKSEQCLVENDLSNFKAQHFHILNDEAVDVLNTFKWDPHAYNTNCDAKNEFCSVQCKSTSRKMEAFEVSPRTCIRVTDLTFVCHIISKGELIVDSRKLMQYPKCPTLQLARNFGFGFGLVTYLVKLIPNLPVPDSSRQFASASALHFFHN